MAVIKLKTKAQRRILKPRNDPYYYQLRKGLHLGFRKAPTTKTETWTARIRIGSSYKHTPIDTGNYVPVDEKDDIYNFAELAALDWAVQVKAGKVEVIKEKKKAESYTVGYVVQKYIDTHKADKNGNVRNWSYEQTKRAKAYIFNRDINNVLLRDLDTGDIKALQRELRWGKVDEDDATAQTEARELMTAASVNRQTTGLRAALNWAHSEGWIKTTPWKKVKPLKIAPKTRRKRNKQYFSLEERKAFLSASTPELRAICTCMMITGCRPSEARRLQVVDIDLDACAIDLMHRKGNNSDLKERTFKLTPEQFKLFRDQVEGKQDEDHVFTTEKGLPWTMANLGKAHKKCREGNDKISNKWESYCWRHSAITDWVNKGVPSANVAAVCGTSIKYIEDNYHETPENLPETLAEAFAGVM